MSTLQQFALYNLSPALVGGTLAWAVVGTGVYLCRLRAGSTHQTRRMLLLK